MRIFSFQKQIINFSGFDKYQDVYESIHKKTISDETEYCSVENTKVCTELDQMKQPLFQKFHL